MAIRKTSWFAVVIAVLLLTVHAHLYAAPTMSVGALAARQSIKNQVVDALSDGYISPAEYHDIFSNAQETLQPQEMAGLQRTMDRLMAQTKPKQTRVVLSSPPQRIGNYLNQYAGWEPRLGQTYRTMPYYRPQATPSLFAGGIEGTLRRLPYIERPVWNGNIARQVARELPRLNEFPTAHPTYLSAKNRGGYIVRTAPAPAPQVRQTAARPYRVSASGASRPSNRIQRVSATSKPAKLPEVETPVAMAPMPDDDVVSPEVIPAAQPSGQSGPNYRTSRTAYLESLRNR